MAPKTFTNFLQSMQLLTCACGEPLPVHFLPPFLTRAEHYQESVGQRVTQ
jgi:hypothetical protein